MYFISFFRNLLITIGLVVVVIIISIHQSFSQVFPVQANINVTPPYSVYLSQYTASDQQKIMATVFLRDPLIPSINVKFRFTIEGGGIKLTTNPAWNPQPYSITPGLITLPQELIAEYLKPQNLLIEGVNPQEFYRSGRLPEGFYEFKIEVVEYNRSITISNVGRTGLWLLLNEPPRIVSPLPNQKIKATDPQMLNFIWVPGGISSPQSALTTQYEFTLVELIDKTIDPTVAITTASSATKFVKTLDQTSFLYGPSEMPLTPGKSYAIRVKAFTTDGFDMFKKGGYSAVTVFTYGDACPPPVSVTLQNQKQSTFEVNVITDPMNTAWQARFREADAGADASNAGSDLQSEPSTWSELKSEPGTNLKTVKNLRASTSYEVEVKGLCGDISSSYLPSKTIKTTEMVNPNRSCSSNATPFAAENAPSLIALSKNDFFFAALFPVKVTEVKSQGGGKFTGSGIATLPLFNAGLAVTFDGIGINNKMQLTSGEVKVVRNELNLTLFGDTPAVTGGGNGDTPGTGNNGDSPDYPPITDTITIPTVYDNIVVNDNNTITIYPPNGGTPVIVSLGGSTSTLLIPADGNMNNAKVVYDGAVHPYTGPGGTTGTNGQEKYSGFRASFYPSTEQEYGFDSMKYQQYTRFYNEMRMGGKSYKLPWKALEQGKPDKVNLRINRSGDGYPYTSLKVSVLGGSELMPTTGNDTPKKTYSVLFPTEGEELIEATYPDSSKTKYAGGLWTATYKKEPFKLFIVPVGDITVTELDKGGIITGLNSIYSKAVVSWSVDVIPGLTGVDLGANGLDWADKEMLSSYNAEMNSLITTFKTWKKDADPDAYYLFIVPKFSEAGVEGFMPRNRRFGFVTYDQLKDRTIAHELGHGAFHLTHTFPEVPQGSTDNLMDYANGTALYKPQWDYIHNPEVTTGLWDGMEDGASIGGNNAIESIKGANELLKSSITVSDSWKTEENIVLQLDKTPLLPTTIITKILKAKVLISTQVYKKEVLSKTKEVKISFCSQTDTDKPAVTFQLPQYKLTLFLKYLGIKNECTSGYCCSVCGRDLTVTLDTLKQIFSNNPNITQDQAKLFTKALKDGNFNTCNRQAHFFAQCKVESANFTSFNELTGYRIKDFFAAHSNNKNIDEFFKQSFWNTNEHKKYFYMNVYEKVDKSKGEKGTHKPNDSITITRNDKSIQVYVDFIPDSLGVYKKVNYTSIEKQATVEKLFDLIYSNNVGTGNGGSESHDGYNYRGRGIIQITGKTTYLEVSNKANSTFKGEVFNWQTDFKVVGEKDKDRIYSAVAFFLWKLNDDLSLLDKDNVFNVSVKVNGCKEKDINGNCIKVNHGQERENAYNDLISKIFNDCYKK